MHSSITRPQSVFQAQKESLKLLKVTFEDIFYHSLWNSLYSSATRRNFLKRLHLTVSFLVNNTLRKALQDKGPFKTKSLSKTIESSEDQKEILIS